MLARPRGTSTLGAGHIRLWKLSNTELSVLRSEHSSEWAKKKSIFGGPFKETPSKSSTHTLAPYLYFSTASCEYPAPSTLRAGGPLRIARAPLAMWLTLWPKSELTARTAETARRDTSRLFTSAARREGRTRMSWPTPTYTGH